MIAAVDHCKTEFERASRRRPPGESMHFRHLRWEALERFLLSGFPETALADRLFTMADPPVPASRERDLAFGRAPDRSSGEMVFINGYVVPEASSTDGRLAGVHIESLSSALERGANEVGEYLSRVARYEELPLAALNTAMFADGAFIKVDSGVTLGAPVRIRFVSNGEADMRPAMSHPRALIVLGERSVATVIESYTGPDGVEYLTNAVSEVVLGAGAHLDHSTLQEEGREALHVETCRVVAASGATMSTHVMQRGAAFVRRDGFETHESDGRVDRRVG